MKKLPVKGLKCLKYLHLIGTGMWFGGALVMLVILYLIHPSTPDGYYIRSWTAQLIDDTLIIPGAFVVLLTGIGYGLWSGWGFFKHNWLTVKWIFAIAMAVLGTTMGQWVNGNVYAPDDVGAYVSNYHAFERNVNLTLFGGTVQTIMLLVVFWISITKPWKKKKEGY